MEYVIEMNHITKQFGNFKANDDITLQVKKGEIHALLGENGAGKSTLMSVLFGLYQPEAGEIKINKRAVKINNPNDANDLESEWYISILNWYTILPCWRVLCSEEKPQNSGR